MERIVIESFMDEKSELLFGGAVAFVEEDIALLLEKQGHIILLKKEYIDKLKEKNISSKLLGKLKSRGFVKKYEQSENEPSLEVLPEFFMIDLTNKCNMHCKYCLRDVEEHGRSIQKNVLIEICNFITDYCEKEKIKNVSIQAWGGEPLLELHNILLMKQRINPLNTKIHFSIETNGLLLDNHIIEELYNNKIDVGISIDGFEEVHDKQRVLFDGYGKTHSLVEKNLLATQKKYGDKLGIITTLTKNNIGNIEEIIEYFVVQLNLASLKFNFVHRSLFSKYSEELCLSTEEISSTEIKILKKIVELTERGYRVTDHNIIVKIRNILFKQFCDICHSNGCSGGKKMITFDMDGNIYPCELTDMPNERIGSIYDNKSLIEIVNTAIKDKDYFVEKKCQKCENCDWYVFCRGGCTVRVMSVGKRPPQIDEIECAVNSVLYPEIVKLIISKPEVINKMLGYDAL